MVPGVFMVRSRRVGSALCRSSPQPVPPSYCDTQAFCSLRRPIVLFLCPISCCFCALLCPVFRALLCRFYALRCSFVCPFLPFMCRFCVPFVLCCAVFGPRLCALLCVSHLALPLGWDTKTGRERTRINTETAVWVWLWAI